MESEAQVSNKNNSIVKNIFHSVVIPAANQYLRYAASAILGAIVALVGASVFFFWRFDPIVEALSLKVDLTTTAVELDQAQIDLNKQNILIMNTKLDLMLDHFNIQNPYLPNR